MKKIAINELRRTVSIGAAKDVTDAQNPPEALDKISISTGIYGMNGGLYRGTDGELYAIIGRGSNLFKVF